MRLSLPDVKAHLLTHLPTVVGAPVISKRPDQSNGVAPAAEFVVVIGTGGAGRSQKVTQETQLTLDSYAATTGKAMALALRVDAAMYALVASDLPVTAVDGWTPTESPDPDTGQARMTATYRLQSRLVKEAP